MGKVGIITTVVVSVIIISGGLVWALNAMDKATHDAEKKAKQ